MRKWKHTLYFYFWTLILSISYDSSNGYKNIRLQDYLCADKFIISLQKPFRGDPSFTLTEDRDSAAIISQVWNQSSFDKFSTHKVKHDCEFRIQTPERSPRGIYTVITRLKFRLDPNSSTCIDYIQFSDGNKSPSERYCQDISADGLNRLIAEDRHRDVKVKIHIDKRHLRDERLELQMILTAHSECKYTSDFLCDPKNPFSCISRHFVRDNITNCIYPCRDEISCTEDDVTTIVIDTTNVALSAITSLIFTMLGVGFCVWVCWKYWNCITVQQRAREASAAARQRGTRNDVPVVELPRTQSFDDVITTGVENQIHGSSPQTPKDLPPSYESLFPDA